MGEVNLTINGRNYGISCDDGQEQRVRNLGQYIDQKVSALASASGTANETHLMMLAALMITDEVFDLRETVEDLGGDSNESAGTLGENEIVVAEAIDHLADRIEGIAEKIKNAA